MMLMKRILPYFLLIMSVCSCVSEKIPSLKDGGFISVTLCADTQTKAYEALDPQESASYTIAVFNADGSPALINGTDEYVPVVDYADFEPVEVHMPGSYYVTAESCTEGEAEDGYGCPRYAGSSEVFDLNISNISENAAVMCSQTNSMVTVVFDQSVSGRFQNLKVELKSEANTSRTLVVTESDQNKFAYFNPSVLKYAVTGTYKATESIATTSIRLEGSKELAAKDDVRLVVRLDMTHGIAGVPGISVIETFDSDETADGVIDPYNNI